MSRHGSCLCCAIAALLVIVSSACAAAAEKAYTLAVIPNLPPVTLHKNWTPFVEQLSKELGVKVELKLYDKIGMFLQDTKNGRADLIYSSPNLFYVAYLKQKYLPLVRSSHMVRGIIFVRKDSPISRMEHLDGKTLAFVGPMNICSVITRHAIAAGREAEGFHSEFCGSTLNVAQNVLTGKADAGVTLDSSMIESLPGMRNEFRIILETEMIAPHPLAAHPRVPKRIQEAITRAVLAMDKTDQGRKILGAVKLSEPIRADYQRDYSYFSNFKDLDTD